jgi:hypothetical protein
MLKRISTGAIIAILLMALVVVAADEHPWFDMEKCSMCSHISSVPGLMEHLSWEQGKISNGMISVAHVDPEFADQYKDVGVKMNATGEKLMAGEEMYLCGSCMEMGTFFMGGAKMENVELDNGDVMILTSDNPELVARMHAHVDKNKAEMQKMMSTMQEKKATQ